MLTSIPTDKGAHLWISRDFNLPDIKWEEETVLPHAISGSASNQLLALAKDLYIHVLGPDDSTIWNKMIVQSTRNSETTANSLELFFTSNPKLINKVGAISGISDHEPVFLKSRLCPMKVKIQRRKVFQRKKADYKGMKKEPRTSLQEFQHELESGDTVEPPSRKKEKHSLITDGKVYSFQNASKKQITEIMGNQGGHISQEKTEDTYKRQHKTAQIKTYDTIKKQRPYSKRQRDNPTGGISRYYRIVSEYDQEIPQSQTADNPMAPRGRAAQPSRDTRKTN